MENSLLLDPQQPGLAIVPRQLAFKASSNRCSSGPCREQVRAPASAPCPLSPKVRGPVPHYLTGR